MKKSDGPSMEWQEFVHRLPDGTRCDGHRSAVPGGWVVLLPQKLGGGVFFYDDPVHKWSGAALPSASKLRPTAKRARAETPAAASLAWQPFLHVLPGAAPREGFRAQVPGGWFVMLAMKPGGGAFFFRDPNHAWGADAVEALSSSATMIGSTIFARASTLLEWQPFRHRVADQPAQDAYRARVPGGWFVLIPLSPGGGTFFYEDPTGAW